MGSLDDPHLISIYTYEVHIKYVLKKKKDMEREKSVIKTKTGTSPAVLWLRLCTSTARGVDSNPWLGN